LPKERWEGFFDDLASSVNMHRPVDIEVTGPAIGDQIAGHHLPLNGFTYDRKSDTFYIYSNGDGRNLDHAIEQPREIWVDFVGSGLSRIVVKQADDQQQFITLREPFALPAGVEDELGSLLHGADSRDGSSL